MAGVLWHLGQVCREARERALLIQSDIAAAGGTNHATISRFESGESLPRRMTVDELVDVYARETNVHPAVLWQRALERSRT